MGTHILLQIFWISLKCWTVLYCKEQFSLLMQLSGMFSIISSIYWGHFLLIFGCFLLSDAYRWSRFSVWSFTMPERTVMTSWYQCNDWGLNFTVILGFSLKSMSMNKLLLWLMIVDRKPLINQTVSLKDDSLDAGFSFFCDLLVFLCVLNHLKRFWYLSQGLFLIKIT